MKATFFRSASHFRRWLETHHETALEVWVGFHKKASGKRGITYAEAVDQALCYGWIDGIKKRVDEHGYTHRFSPRRSRSIWSTINVARATALERLGKMQPRGLAAFKKRDPERSGVYSFENRPKRLTRSLERRFSANRKAWTFFQAQPPGYRRLMTFMVMSAKQDETKARRLARLIEASANQTRMT